MVVNIIFLVKNRFLLLFLWKQVIIPPPHSRQYPPLPASKETTGQKDLSCHCDRDLFVCVQALSARMTAGLSQGMPGHVSGICQGPMSVSMIPTANSTWFPSGGGARTAMHSWMICGERGNRPFCIRSFFLYSSFGFVYYAVCPGRKRGKHVPGIGPCSS